MRIRMARSIVFLASVVCLSEACPGDTVCMAEVSPASWCRPETNTCQGDSSVKCNCDSPKSKSRAPKKVRKESKAATAGRSVAKGRSGDSVCTEIDPSSWCREDGLCAKMKNVPCGLSKTKNSQDTTESLNHAICTALDPKSWCREDFRCARLDNVYCGSKTDHAAVAKVVDTKVVDAKIVDRKVVDAKVAKVPKVKSKVVKRVEVQSKVAKRVEVPAVLKTTGSRPVGTTSGVSEAMVLWTEWPTLEEGGWPDYFATLLSFVNNNCGGLGFHKLIMRVLNPGFQSTRGLLWQIDTDAVFYTNFLKHLPANVEVLIYPYLLDGSSARAWKAHMKEETALGSVYKYAHDWNEVLITSKAKARIGGIVTDKEEQKFFKDDMPALRSFKDKFSHKGQSRLTFGIAIGYDSAGSIPHLNADGQIDDVYLEMYDFYVHGSYPAEHVHAHKGGALNNPQRFLDILDDEVWSRYINKYQENINIIFMWSIQNQENDKCIYPTNEKTCGTKVDFGSWKIGAFRQFLDKLVERHPVFGQRQHALFQLSFVPHSWMPGQCQ